MHSCVYVHETARSICRGGSLMIKGPLIKGPLIKGVLDAAKHRDHRCARHIQIFAIKQCTSQD